MTEGRSRTPTSSKTPPAIAPMKSVVRHDRDRELVAAQLDRGHGRDHR